MNSPWTVKDVLILGACSIVLVAVLSSCVAYTFHDVLR